MLEQFLSYCKTHNLIHDNQRVLVAISGGADSVVLSHLFYTSNIPFALAHCNFKLRAEASDADELFVRSLAKTYNCQLFVQSFETTQFAAEKKLSIEMAARQLRYEWFETVRKEHSFDAIATAHHQEDNAETILLNVIRGTGIRGLLGIKNKTATIIRPLLFADKASILSYVADNGLDYRTDESNFEDIYKRNKLRNAVFPLLKELNPSVIATFNENAERIGQSFKLYEQRIEALLSDIIVEKTEDIQKVSIQKLQATGFADVLIYEWLQPFGFTASVFKNVEDVLHAQSGKRFLSGEYELIKDRETLVLSKLVSIVEPIIIYIDTRKVETDITLSISTIPLSDCDFKTSNNAIAFLDAAKVQFPLTLRRWNHGDAFVPLGMKQHKKLSDFLIDHKVSVSDKKKTFVMVDAHDEILWVVGYRLAEKAKITEHTKDVLKFVLG